MGMGYKFLRPLALDLDNNSRIRQLHKLDEFWTVFTDKGLFVVASDVVPDDPVAVKVVEHGQTCLVIFTLKLKIPIRIGSF